MAIICEGQLEEIHVGDIGTIMQVTIKECVDGVVKIVDVSGVGDREIIFKKSDGSVVTETATFVTNGTDGKIKYVSVADFFNVAGDWQMQGKVADVGGWTGRSSVVDFVVSGNLDD